MLSRLVRTLALVLVLATGVTFGAPTEADAGQRGHVLEKRVIGRSVKGRDINAWHLDNSSGRGPTVVLIATMHGNEGAPRGILDSLRRGGAVRGVDLWLVPVYNPDGLAAHHRRNAHGVDLNRNYPYHWAPLTGSYFSGPKPASEIEYQL